MPDEMDENGPDVSDHVSENEDEPESYTQDDDDGKMGNPNSADGTTEVKRKYDPKDPLRPRRKKARRACFACQRAHLTCGDERPCQRCIKRGLAEACQDGVRKKAKYLHDAPPEALGPVLGPNFNRNGAPTRPNGHRQDSNASDHTVTTTPGGTSYFGAPATFPVYQAGGQPPLALNDPMNFNPQVSPVSPSFQSPVANPQSQMGSMGLAPPPTMDFTALFDPSNPALYNFDLEGLNFGSQYAGWEFGILNKMGLGADTPPRENSLSRTPTTEANYAGMFGAGGNPTTFDASGPMAGDFAAGLDQKPNNYAQGNLQHGLPHAYAIAAGPSSLASPSTEATSSPQLIDGSPKPGAFGGIPTVSAPPRPKQKHKANQNLLVKKQRDSASIYESVKEPYPYTAGFHTLISVLRNRYQYNKVLKIARALAEIRPSFIACTKDLTREDLVFMEKCFQRTLVEYNDFLQHCSAPTIVCRRTGEVAAVNKEFTALTGWTKEVMLGQESNLHVAWGSSDGQNADDIRNNDGRSGMAATENGGTRPQPVFLAEIMDDDSVVQFYQDFAQLAFEDSRGKVQRNCRLVKYRSKDNFEAKGPPSHNEARTGILSSRVTKIESEHGISRIEKDGKVDCTYCWTIKRDVFDIPMMIIVNFLPRYLPNQEPHQLAV
jgi:PAS domain-containing protein